MVGTEAIGTITDVNNDHTVLPVPNYYWKALLKVKWSGTTVTSASTIGFWLHHGDLKDESRTTRSASIRLSPGPALIFSPTCQATKVPA